MKQQVFAVLSLVIGLLGFNLIAVAQTMAYMQIKQYLVENPGLDFEMFAIGNKYKICTLIMGIIALVLFFIYQRSADKHARLFNGLGGILGLVSILLSIFPVYKWLV